MKIKNTPKLPPVVDLLITSNCNLDCKFCFGPSIQKELAFKNLKNIIEKLVDFGVKSLVISGGEPLLYKRIEDLLFYCKQKKLKIVLSTNGILLEKKSDRILPFIDWLSLPIESYTFQLHSKARPGFPRQLELIVKLIKNVKRKYPKLKIKIGTVVTKQNINDLEKIAEFIIENNIFPDVWKLYEFGPRGRGRKNKDTFFITTKEFLSKAKKAKRVLKKARKETKIVIKLYKQFDKADLLMHPNGNAVCLIKGRDKIIGNFVKDFEKLLKEWPKYINVKQLIKHHNLTYTNILKNEAKD